jgi:hypothetical protein
MAELRPPFTPEDDAALFDQVTREMGHLVALPARPVLPTRGGDYRVALALQDLHVAQCALATLEAVLPPADDVVRYRSKVALARRAVARQVEALRAARMRVLVVRMDWLRRPDREEAQPQPQPVKPVQLGLFADAPPTPTRPTKQPKQPARVEPAAPAVVAEAAEVVPLATVVVMLPRPTCPQEMRAHRLALPRGPGVAA